MIVNAGVIILGVFFGKQKFGHEGLAVGDLDHPAADGDVAAFGLFGSFGFGLFGGRDRGLLGSRGSRRGGFPVFGPVLCKRNALFVHGRRAVAPEGKGHRHQRDILAGKLGAVLGEHLDKPPFDEIHERVARVIGHGGGARLLFVLRHAVFSHDRVHQFLGILHAALGAHPEHDRHLLVALGSGLLHMVFGVFIFGKVQREIGAQGLAADGKFDQLRPAAVVAVVEPTDAVLAGVGKDVIVDADIKILDRILGKEEPRGEGFAVGNFDFLFAHAHAAVIGIRADLGRHFGNGLGHGGLGEGLGGHRGFFGGLTGGRLDRGGHFDGGFGLGRGFGHGGFSHGRFGHGAFAFGHGGLGRFGRSGLCRGGFLTQPQRFFFGNQERAKENNHPVRHQNDKKAGRKMLQIKEAVHAQPHRQSRQQQRKENRVVRQEERQQRERQRDASGHRQHRGTVAEGAQDALFQEKIRNFRHRGAVSGNGREQQIDARKEKQNRQDQAKNAADGHFFLCHNLSLIIIK